MAKERVSAGILMYRIRDGMLQVFLAHPGGPYFRRKNLGHWTIPKGELDPGEEPIAAARREFEEEIGIPLPEGPLLPLGSIIQKGGKTVHAWACRGDWPDGQSPQGNTFRCEWPPDSGQWLDFPEVDQAGFFSIPEARQHLKESQHPFLDRLIEARIER